MVGSGSGVAQRAEQHLLRRTEVGHLDPHSVRAWVSGSPRELKRAL